MDGTRDGLRIDEGRALEIGGCRDGKRKVDDGYDRCVPYRAYQPDLPADAAGMLAYLKDDTRGEGTGDNNVKAEAMTLLQDHLPAASRAAILEVLATMPGVIVCPGALDPIGRPAIGVDPVIGGFTGDEFFLDPADYHYLGRAGLGAVVTSGVVDEVGQLP
ncbi:hypothetical protein [Amycolatopsis magusensis]|uniref:hypothetical protein n=1 Tax=Amycolatopsis magusensis TaxID=882444 RepID=UPI0024A8900C|nr:hypothetical protein [Amycolatopsis magusensis]MDI5976783.1 hypothetical protein [Amycolatopsis magusensis]